jgi:hypothetical protein
MALYACVVTRFPKEAAGAPVVVYLITVIVTVAVWLAGHSLPDAVFAAAGVGWAASVPARMLREAR